jgi:hypothetical protein
LKANKVTSTKTPVQYEYYDLPFCKRGKSRSRAENLGERLTGDTTTNSPYEVGNSSVYDQIIFEKVHLIYSFYS